MGVLPSLPSEERARAPAGERVCSPAGAWPPHEDGPRRWCNPLHPLFLPHVHGSPGLFSPIPG
uniref:Uncharacterized protein n=1 Tax=Proteomonas sulcata TaxID=77928 RepID=Q075N2_9CRYP|nr:hypothetical protein [Proteomonas sulcata]